MVAKAVAVFLSVVSRLVLLFVSFAVSPVWFWVGWLFTPGLLLAILVSINIGSANIWFTVLAWGWAIATEVIEKTRLWNYHRECSKFDADGPRW